MIIRYSLIGLLWELRWCWAWFIVNNQYLQLTLRWKTYQHVLLIESVLQTAPILKTYNLKFHFPVKSWFCIQIIYFPHSLLSENRTVAVNIFLCDRDIGKFITSRDIKCMRHWTCAGLSQDIVQLPPFICREYVPRPHMGVWNHRQYQTLTNTMFFPICTYLWHSSIYKLGTVRD